MSAIFGSINLDGRPADAAQLRRTGELLAHRGPDGAGYWSEGCAALGHRLLRTTPEAEGESQPVICAASGLVLVADARIDNRSELLAALGLNSPEEREASDADIILRAFRRWGSDCASRLQGDYAFAVWNPKSRTVFLARDPMGVRSLYYHLIPSRTFTFATEIKGVISQPHVPNRTCEDYIAGFLTTGYSDSPQTIYQGVLRLPAAHQLIVTPDSDALTRHWMLDTERRVRLGSDDEYAEAFRELFHRAVSSRLRSSHPVGSLLSGGLDSSSITVSASHTLRGNSKQSLSTFSLVFPDMSEADRRRIDERSFIHSVLDVTEVEPHFVAGDRLDPFGCLERSLASQDQPVFAPNLYLHEGLYAAAREAGVRVLLDGVDGDSVVSHGWEYLTELARTGSWSRLLQECRALAARYRVPLRYILLHRVLAGALPETAYAFLARLSQRSLNSAVGPSVLSAAFERRTQNAAVSRPRDRRRGSHSARAHAAGIESGLISHMVELVDKSAASFGIEPRYPFLDQRLMQFCVSLPPDQKLKDGWHRLILRRAMAPLLPDCVAWRTCKGNLSPSFCRGLLSGERRRLEAAVANYSECLSPYLDLKVLGQLLERYSQAPVASAGEAATIYNAILLGKWLNEDAEWPQQGAHLDHRANVAPVAHPCTT